jgi:hypothetical protein
MGLTELLPVLHDLPRPDKFRVVQILTAELAEEEALLRDGTEYPIWSPHDAYGAAATLTEFLHQNTGK